MKKKSNVTYCAHLLATGFQQLEGLHFNIAEILSPVTSDTSIHLVLTMMTIAGHNTRVIDIKASFLQGKLKKNKEIYMKILEGFDKFFPQQVSWLQIKKPNYNLKQVVLYYSGEAKWAMQVNGFERSEADPCLLYTWRNEGLVIWVMLVDDIWSLHPLIL